MDSDAPDRTGNTPKGVTGRHEVPLILRGQAAATIVTVGLGLLVLVGGLSVVTYIATGTWWLPGFQKTPSALTSEPFSLGDLIKISLALVAGVGAAVGLVTTYRRQALSEREERAADVIRFDQRFASAAAQLGGATPANRIAGVYAVAALADQYPRHRQQCVDVLCGYLRLPFNPDEDGIATTETTVVTATQDRTVTERTLPARTPHDLEVRHTIQLVIADHLRDPDSATSWTPMTLNLRGAHLHDAGFIGCHFGRSLFSGTTFTAVARFDGATFTEYAEFVGATFTGNAVFVGACFTKSALFDGATFTRGAVFFGATFSENAVFGGATFTEAALFDGATFTRGAVFVAATFTQDASFDGATFTGNADFHGAAFTGHARFGGTAFAREACVGGATFANESDRPVWPPPQDDETAT